jgi:hypothetical protein
MDAKIEGELSAVNGGTRGDGYDAYMRPVTRRDNAPGGATHLVTYVAVVDGHERLRYCYSEAEARAATLYGYALDGTEVRS